MPKSWCNWNRVFRASHKINLQSILGIVWMALLGLLGVICFASSSEETSDDGLVVRQSQFVVAEAFSRQILPGGIRCVTSVVLIASTSPSSLQKKHPNICVCHGSAGSLSFEGCWIHAAIYSSDVQSRTVDSTSQLHIVHDCQQEEVLLMIPPVTKSGDLCSMGSLSHLSANSTGKTNADNGSNEDMVTGVIAFVDGVYSVSEASTVPVPSRLVAAKHRQFWPNTAVIVQASDHQVGAFPMAVVSPSMDASNSKRFLESGVMSPCQTALWLQSGKLQVKKEGTAKCLFFDVGANMGWFTALAAREGCEVVAVEAQQALASVWRVTSHMNQWQDQVTWLPIAVGSKSTSLKLDIPIGNLGQAAVNFEDKDRNSSENAASSMVSVHTLCSLLKGQEHQLRGIKVDVEGAEAEALSGLSACISRLINLQWASLEVDGDKNIALTCSAIEKLSELLPYAYQYQESYHRTLEAVFQSGTPVLAVPRSQLCHYVKGPRGHTRFFGDLLLMRAPLPTHLVWNEQSEENLTVRNALVAISSGQTNKGLSSLNLIALKSGNPVAKQALCLAAASEIGNLDDTQWQCSSAWILSLNSVFWLASYKAAARMGHEDYMDHLQNAFLTGFAAIQENPEQYSKLAKEFSPESLQFVDLPHEFKRLAAARYWADNAGIDVAHETNPFEVTLLHCNYMSSKALKAVLVHAKASPTSVLKLQCMGSCHELCKADLMCECLPEEQNDISGIVLSLVGLTVSVRSNLESIRFGKTHGYEIKAMRAAVAHSRNNSSYFSFGSYMAWTCASLYDINALAVYPFSCLQSLMTTHSSGSNPSIILPQEASFPSVTGLRAQSLQMSSRNQQTEAILSHLKTSRQLLGMPSPTADTRNFLIYASGIAELFESCELWKTLKTFLKRNWVVWIGSATASDMKAFKSRVASFGVVESAVFGCQTDSKSGSDVCSAMNALALQSSDLCLPVESEAFAFTSTSDPNIKPMLQGTHSSLDPFTDFKRENSALLPDKWIGSTLWSALAGRACVRNGALNAMPGVGGTPYDAHIHTMDTLSIDERVQLRSNVMQWARSTTESHVNDAMQAGSVMKGVKAHSDLRMSEDGGKNAECKRCSYHFLPSQSLAATKS